jgi:glucokinase
MDVIGAIDMGGTKIAVGLISPFGGILTSEQILTQSQLTPTAGLQAIMTTLDHLLDITGGDLIGIGIGCTGQVNPVTHSLGDNAFLPGWEGAVMIAELRQHFHVDIELENDAVAAALAEAVWGAGRGLVTSLYITVSTGIGGGLVQHGRAYCGTGGAHPEIGHHTIDPSGPACYCGAHGCWESLASGRAMAAWYMSQAVEKNGDPAFVSLTDISAETICAATARGDPLARTAVWREGYYLGIGLANLVTMFSPDAIILGGGVMTSLPLFRGQIEKAIHESCRLVPYEKVRLLRASLGDQLGLAGAGQVWLQQHTLPSKN